MQGYFSLLASILAQAVQQLAQLRQIMGAGRDTLGLMRDVNEGIREGFSRAWLSIRDSNLSSIITAVILYTLATSALVKGFALVFLIGVLVSMLTAITVSRTLLLAIGVKSYTGITKFLFGNGLKK